ncbi:MAG: xanthine dehydrogenase family protein molybdopterin-binding subunit [Chloroflexota bacterium]
MRGSTIGKPLSVVDGPQRVSGTIDYAIDIEKTDMLHGKVVRSPYAHAKVVSIDTSMAEDVEGVVKVITRDDFKDQTFMSPVFGAVLRDQLVVADDVVRYVGDIVAIVVAESEAIAEEAVLLVDVDYDEFPAVFDPIEAMKEDAPKLHDLSEEKLGKQYYKIRPIWGTNCCHHFRLRKGDMEKAWADSDLVIERTYSTPSAAHVAMEPLVTVAYFEEDGGVVIETGNQGAFDMQKDFARMLNLPPEKVRVIVPSMGGSFGIKMGIRTEAAAVAGAWLTGRPVKVAFRYEEMFLTINRHPCETTIKMGMKADGTILGKQVTCHYNTGAYADSGPGVTQKGGFGSIGPYNIPNCQVDSYGVYTNTVPNGAYRGYAVTQVAWAYESMMDEIAEALNLDPVAFRLKNIIGDGDAYATGEIMHDSHYDTCLKHAAEALEWGQPLSEHPEPHIKRGRGLAVILKGTSTPTRSAARLEITADGQYIMHQAAAEVGQGARTVLAQMAAEALDIDPYSIKNAGTDTTISPYDHRTSSSRETYMVGTALQGASKTLAEKLKKLAAEQMEADMSDLVLQAGHIMVSGVPESRKSLGDVVRDADLDSLDAEDEFTNEGGVSPDDGQGIASSHWHQGACAIQVAVDTETGRVELEKFSGIAYVGQVINSLTANLQMDGSMLMGFGTTFYEAIELDDGQVINPNLSDYMIPSIVDMPDSMTHKMLENPGSEVHGLGETMVPIVGPAVGNAIYDAIGVRIRDLTITPEKVLRGLMDQE